MKWAFVFLVYWLVGIGINVSVDNHKPSGLSDRQQLFMSFLWPAQASKLATDIAFKVRDGG
jgi:hypothetical protein